MPNYIRFRVEGGCFFYGKFIGAQPVRRIKRKLEKRSAFRHS
jgi:hypothetical protein